jgi:hypothetical protein
MPVYARFDEKAVDPWYRNEESIFSLYFNNLSGCSGYLAAGLMVGYVQYYTVGTVNQP